MAGCYHDKQDFKSDLNIEVAREGDMLQEGQDLKDIVCDKNPGHEGFIPFKDLTLDHLPIGDRTIETLDHIKDMGSRVVRLVVNKLKNGRLKPKKKGSGNVIYNENYNEFSILTNNHVVKTDDEVKQCTVDFHFDDESRFDVLTSRGTELIWTCPVRDITHFKFCPVPDFLFQQEITRIVYIVIMYNNNQIKNDTTIIHTGRHSIYSRRDLNSPLIDLMFISLPGSSISYLKSSYFKFQPIPSNLQQLTSIEIHIDDDDGNSRVIPGDVVQFGDDFVVKISETIFQDEVEKCRLVCNGDVLGCGTRLYFQQFKTSDIHSGIDLEEDIEEGTDTYWIFEFHPVPKELEAMLHTKRSKNICCIGHPHGGIKMVTFGRTLWLAPERFDNQYRRINKPDPDCQCKEVNCLHYSCKTCAGSSGSPVFQLCKGVDWGKGFVIHFWGKRVTQFNGEKVNKVLIDGDLIENFNMASAPLP